jgi:hypothetical protein
MFNGGGGGGGCGEVRVPLTVMIQVEYTHKLCKTI